MPYKSNPQCKVCKIIEAQAKEGKKTLFLDIYKSKSFIATHDRTIFQIYKDHEKEFNYSSIRNHVINHQTLSLKELQARNTRALAKQANDRVRSEKIAATTVWDGVITEGMTRLKSGEMELRASDLLKATKDKSDYELKVKDQQLQLAAMVAYFASGEGDENESLKYDRRIVEGKAVEEYDPAEVLAPEQPPNTPDRRAAQSRAFYQSIVGNAAAPRTN